MRLMLRSNDFLIDLMLMVEIVESVLLFPETGSSEMQLTGFFELSKGSFVISQSYEGKIPPQGGKNEFFISH